MEGFAPEIGITFINKVTKACENIAKGCWLLFTVHTSMFQSTSCTTYPIEFWKRTVCIPCTYFNWSVEIMKKYPATRYFGISLHVAPVEEVTFYLSTPYDIWESPQPHPTPPRRAVRRIAQILCLQANWVVTCCSPPKSWYEKDK